MKYFCTYFDSNFIYRGLALYDSLCAHAGDFTLWVLCFDQKAEALLRELNLPYLHTITLEEFEAAQPILLKIKERRSFLEYYWTTTPLLPLFIFKSQPHVDSIAYLDADLFFYSDVQPIYKEWGSGSIYIIPHRFTPAVRQQGEFRGGIYNVGFVGFRQDASGLACLERWSRQCMDWCYLRYDEPGLLGDQKYLDDWPDHFKGVVVSQNHGVGAGGWNILFYRISKINNIVYLDDSPLVLLHLNFVELLSNRFFTGPSRWSLRPIYLPYAYALRKAIRQIKMLDPNFRPHFAHIALWRCLARLIRGGIIPI